MPGIQALALEFSNMDERKMVLVGIGMQEIRRLHQSRKTEIHFSCPQKQLKRMNKVNYPIVGKSLMMVYIQVLKCTPPI